MRGENSFECKGGGHDDVKFRRSGGAPKPDRSAPAEDAYYAFQETTTQPDREEELRELARGAFTRIPGSGAGKTFHAVCSSIAKSCEEVVDWEGRRHSCSVGAHDGSRMALCTRGEAKVEEAPPGENPLYGALAFNEKTGAYGWAIDHPTPEAATRRALQECRQGCSIVLQFSNECAAFVKDDKGGTAYGWAKGKSLPEVHYTATSECMKRGGSCTAQVWGCTTRR